MIDTVRIEATTTGSAGSATGTGVSEHVVKGKVLRVDINYHASAPASTDITLAQTNEVVAANIVAKDNSATDATYYPRVQVTNNGGTGLTLEGSEPMAEPYVVCDTLTLTVSGSNALTNCVVADVYYET